MVNITPNFVVNLTGDLANSTTCLAPLATFIFFVISTKFTSKTLDTAAAFTALSLISLLSRPVNTFIQAIPMVNTALACLQRIELFLTSDARKDHRLEMQESTTANVLDRAGDNIEMHDLSLSTRPSFQANAQVLVATKNASFSWIIDGRPAVSDVSFNLYKSQFCFVIGPVGSGKSTLLKGLLGETPSTQGFVYTSHPSIAYVDQTPWIQNGNVQQNILGTSTFEESWYKQVIYVCGLDQDISMMPRGHGECNFRFSGRQG